MSARILIVDDEPDIRDMMRYALIDAGYETLEAGDGITAQQLMRTSPEPLVVLLDLMLPRLGGSDIIQGLASAPPLERRHPIIATTANYRESRTLDLILSQFAIPVLRKPFEITDLLGKIQAAQARLSAAPSVDPASPVLAPVEGRNVVGDGY